MARGRYPRARRPCISGTVRAMEFGVSQDHRDPLASLRSFLDREVGPVEDRYAQQMQEDVMSDEIREEGLRLRRKSAELGFYAAHMPEAVGGMGLSAVGYTLLVEGNAKSGMRVASFVLGPPNPEAPTPILMDLPEHLRGKFVEPLVRGETTMCFALTEPGAGSDAQSISTSAELDGTEWVLNGTKHFITNGARADVAIVFAVTDKEKRANGGITALLVERDSPGYTVGRKQTTLAGDTNQAEVVFEDCRVPQDHVIGEVGFWFFTAM